MLLVPYVDDILLAATDLEMIKVAKQWLSSVFEIKKIVKARYVLRMEIICSHPENPLGMC